MSVEGLRNFINQEFVPRRHTVLLVAIVTAFFLRPLLGDFGIGPLLFSFALMILMLVSLYNIQVDELLGEREALIAQKKWRGFFGWAIAIPAIIERLLAAFIWSPTVVLLGALFWLMFFAYITWNEMRAVLRQRQVTRESISLSISVYLLMGITWGLLYVVLFILQPAAFSFGGSATSGTSNQHNIFPILVYFSLTTLSTIGFGDITPITLQARYMAVAEGITGQFYLAILVARLVGLYMSQAASGTTEK
jgi:voltage-gated potassium channel